MANILASPRLALSVLLFLAVFIGTVSWFPWTLDRQAKAPRWAAAIGLDHPYGSAYFLTAVFLLLVNTLACTIERTGRAWSLINGVIPPRIKAQEYEDGSDAVSFLGQQGFRTKSGPPYFKNRFALSKGWLFHVGLVALILGVLVQQAFHESGSFEIGEGEMVRLSDVGVVFDHDAGMLAGPEFPGFQIALEQFDPYLHQEGYAPDRASTLLIRTSGGEQRTVLDRARGTNVNGVSIYQAIPFGLALNVEIAGSGIHSLHLRQVAPDQSAAEFKDPAGGLVRFIVDTERAIDDALGTGKLRIYLVQGGKRTELSTNTPFSFGNRTATIISVSRWAGFTYSRSPGVSLVFAGFFLILAGTLVMLIPAGLAVTERNDITGSLRVYLTQGADDFAKDWHGIKSSRVL